MPFGTTPAGYGLQALANVLAGTGQGAQQADVLNQRWTGLGQSQQALQQQQAQRMADVPTLFKSLGLPVPEGAGQTPIPVADLMLKTAEGRRIQGMQEQRSGQTADALATSHPELAQLVRSGVLNAKDVLPYVGVKPAPQQPHMVPAGSPGFVTGDKFTPIPRTQEAPEETKIDLNTGERTKTAQNSLTGAVRTTRDMASLSDQFTAHYNRAASLMNKSRTAPLTTEETQQLAQSKSAMDNLKPLLIPAGGTQFERMPGGPTAGASGVGGMPGAIRTNPTNPAGSDIKDAGDRNNIIQQLEGTAALVKTMPQMQTAMGRGGLALRGFIQGHTPFEALSSEEQAYVVTHENLRQLLIQAQMGLGPFRSPEMQAQLKDTIGRYWTPGTDARLTALAGLLRGQQSGIAGAEAAGNRIPIHTPPPVANPNQNSPQTKGAVWQLRETATGRVRRYQPAPGETQPPAGYELVR